MASPTATSPCGKFCWLLKRSSILTTNLFSQGRGRSDKTPVCNQNLPEAERSVHMDAVLPWPCVHLCTTHQEPVTFVRLRATTVSLCGMAPVPAYARIGTTECLLTSTKNIALYSMDVNMVVLWHDRKETTAIGHNDTFRRARQGSDSSHQGDVWLPVRCSNHQTRFTDDSQSHPKLPNKDSAFLPSRERRRASCLRLGEGIGREGCKCFIYTYQT